MEMDPDWCLVDDDSGDEESELSSPSQHSDQDSGRKDIQHDVGADECQQSEQVHCQPPFHRLKKRKAKRRVWKGDIPFLISHRTKSLSQQSLGISHSCPVPTLRREDARLSISQQPSPFSASLGITGPSSPIPKFTLSNLRSNIHSKTYPPSLTHRLTVPQRFSSLLPSLRTGHPPSSASTSCSAPLTEQPSTLPSAFRSRSKASQEGGAVQSKKQVLLKLENYVIVQPSSSYREPRRIDSSANFAPRSPPLHAGGSSSNMPPKTEPKVDSSSDSAEYDSPPASLLAAVKALPDTRSPSLGSPPGRPRDVRVSPSSRTDFPPKTTGGGKDSVATEAAEVKAAQDKDEIPPHQAQAAPKNVPYPPQARGRSTHLLNLKAGDKRGSSSSLSSETPALKHSKSSTCSTEGVFFFDEDIDRYQGSGPDDNDGVCQAALALR